MAATLTRWPSDVNHSACVDTSVALIDITARGTGEFPRAGPDIVVQVTPRFRWDGVRSESDVIATLRVFARDPKFLFWGRVSGQANPTVLESLRGRTLEGAEGGRQDNPAAFPSAQEVAAATSKVWPVLVEQAVRIFFW